MAKGRRLRKNSPNARLKRRLKQLFGVESDEEAGPEEATLSLSGRTESWKYGEENKKVKAAQKKSAIERLKRKSESGKRKQAP